MKPLQGCLEAAFIRKNCGWKGWGDVMVGQVENRMAVDSEWEIFQQPVKEDAEKSNCVGWTEISTGVFIPEEDAFNRALEMISLGTEGEKKEFVEWFYSGNWVKEE